MDAIKLHIIPPLCSMFCRSHDWLEEAESLLRDADTTETAVALACHGVARELFKTPVQKACAASAQSCDCSLPCAADVLCPRAGQKGPSPTMQTGWLEKAETVLQEHALMHSNATFSSVRIKPSQLVQTDKDEMSRRCLIKLLQGRDVPKAPHQVAGAKDEIYRSLQHTLEDYCNISLAARHEEKHLGRCTTFSVVPDLEMDEAWGRELRWNRRGDKEFAASRGLQQKVKGQLLAKILRTWSELARESTAAQLQERVLEEAEQIIAAAQERERERREERAAMEVEMDVASDAAACAFRWHSLAKCGMVLFLHQVRHARDIDERVAQLGVKWKRRYAWRWWVRALAAFRLDSEAKARAAQRKDKLEALVRGLATQGHRPLAAAKAAAAGKHGTKTRKDDGDAGKQGLLQHSAWNKKRDAGAQACRESLGVRGQAFGCNYAGAGTHETSGKDDGEELFSCNASPQDSMQHAVQAQDSFTPNPLAARGHQEGNARAPGQGEHERAVSCAEQGTKSKEAVSRSVDQPEPVPVESTDHQTDAQSLAISRQTPGHQPNQVQHHMVAPACTVLLSRRVGPATARRPQRKEVRSHVQAKASASRYEQNRFLTGMQEREALRKQRRLALQVCTCNLIVLTCNLIQVCTCNLIVLTCNLIQVCTCNLIVLTCTLM
jgi:hypothetical protein